MSYRRLKASHTFVSKVKALFLFPRATRGDWGQGKVVGGIVIWGRAREMRLVCLPCCLMKDKKNVQLCWPYCNSLPAPTILFYSLSFSLSMSVYHTSLPPFISFFWYCQRDIFLNRKDCMDVLFKTGTTLLLKKKIIRCFKLVMTKN